MCFCFFLQIVINYELENHLMFTFIFCVVKSVLFAVLSRLSMLHQTDFIANFLYCRKKYLTALNKNHLNTVSLECKRDFIPNSKNARNFKLCV